VRKPEHGEEAVSLALPIRNIPGFKLLENKDRTS
jgi:hypothetical protein